LRYIFSTFRRVFEVFHEALDIIHIIVTTDDLGGENKNDYYSQKSYAAMAPLVLMIPVCGRAHSGQVQKKCQTRLP
jgi:hypothetical protein